MSPKFFLFFLFCCSFLFAQGTDIDSLLVQLDKKIKISQSFVNDKNTRIGSLKKLLEVTGTSDDQALLINSKLFEEYRAFVFDSALFHIGNVIKLAEKLGKSERIIEAKLQQIDLLSATGMYNEAADIFKAIDQKKLIGNLKARYFSSGELLYLQLSRYSRLNEFIPLYREINSRFRDSLLRSLPQDADKYLRIKEMSLLEQGRVDASRALINTLISRTKENTTDYAYLAYRLSITYELERKHELQKEYLIKSALADIEMAVKDNASLAMLANLLYKEGSVEKAYEYIKFAMDDANKFNAPLRYIELSSILPLINEAYQLRADEHRNKLRNYLWMISLLSVFLAIAIALAYEQVLRVKRARNLVVEKNKQLFALNNEFSLANQKLNSLNNELAESNHIKEQYIGHFLDRCSNYIEKLEKYQRHVNKQISLHKVAELFEETKSKQFIESELVEFYTNFDHTFLHLYPDFVLELNSLLRPDEQIVLKKGELLNTELRIFALVRLGITDSSKIALLLRYSVNTIYNYRVKMKNKAIVPRDDFEEQVMKIGTLFKRKEL